MTKYHSKYYSHFLTLQHPNLGVDRLSHSMFNATIDLNPHQVDAALFFFDNPLSNWVILADEVWLGKTIEAWLVLNQLRSEYKRKILLIVPASLRKQRSAELVDKFHIPSIVLDNKTYKELSKWWNNPFSLWKDSVIICSYEFVAKRWNDIIQQQRDLIVIDEAHKLRNVYKPDNKRANEIKSITTPYRKLLLTATPLQNSLLELYGLVSFVDEQTFWDLTSFKSQFVGDNVNFDDLKERISPLIHRTLRKQVLEYISYTNRRAITQSFTPSENEQKLYEYVSEFLQRDSLKSVNNSQKTLITLIFRKLLASSTRAIAGTLDTMINRLENSHDFSQLIDDEDLMEVVSEDYNEELWEPTWDVMKATLEQLQSEIKELKEFKKIAYGINVDEKTKSLLTALDNAFARLSELWANKKALIFTESRRTQDYLKEYLEQHGYANKIVLFNWTNKHPESVKIYEQRLQKHANTSMVTGSKESDMRAALVEHFKENDDCQIMLATESAAEWVNLQFCSLLINYDLPWNPQRIEQRIGRCHRYGQKHDVIVVNFLNTKNLADQRVFQLLEEKFKLFEWVFGASDEVLWSIEDGKDFEKKILEIYQNCRTDEEIKTAFDTLQDEYKESIDQRLWDTRKKVLDNFDEDVARNLKLKKEQTSLKMDITKEYFWNLTKVELQSKATFEEYPHYRFQLDEELQDYSGSYNLVPNVEQAWYTYRTTEWLWEYLIQQAKTRILSDAYIYFDYSNHETNISILEDLVGSSWYLIVSKLRLQSFETEEYLIVSGYNDDGEIISSNILEKLFSLQGMENQALHIEASHCEKLESIKEQSIKNISYGALERNGKYFDETITKLDKWAEDKKYSLEVQLKEIKKEIATKKTESRKVIELEMKVQIQKQIKNLETKQKELRRKLFEAEDEIDNHKEKLIWDLEKRLRGWSSVEDVMRIRWKIV
jgi:superfamily II DNA/RNA helicase